MSDLSNALRKTAEGHWQNHPSFAGVRLCRLVGPDDSDNRLSTLLVELAPGAVMAAHRHEGETEQHLVLDGAGTLTLAGQETAYHTGVLKIVPMGVVHAVSAGPRGMTMLAVFSPSPK